MQPANTHTHTHVYNYINNQELYYAIKIPIIYPPKIARIVLVYLHAVYLPLSVKKRGSFVLDSLVWRVFNSNDARKSFFKYTKFHIYVDVVTENFYFMIVGIKVSIWMRTKNGPMVQFAFKKEFYFQIPLHNYLYFPCTIYTDFC